MATVVSRHRDVKVLHHVPYKMYVRLVADEANYHLRMAYNDGVLQIVSPLLHRHEGPSARLRIVVTTVADVLGLASQGADSATFRRSGDGPYQGKGKEADQSFFISSVDRLRFDREPDLDAGDPPPDLWIETDNRVPVRDRLAILAGLGIPEVWIYLSKRKTIRFLRRIGDRYEPIELSPALPRLSPALVLEALALGEGLPESSWVLLLREWAARKLGPPAGGG